MHIQLLWHASTRRAFKSLERLTMAALKNFNAEMGLNYEKENP